MIKGHQHTSIPTVNFPFRFPESEIVWLYRPERVERNWPVLREAIHKSASAQLRNLATIGANLLQKTRCAYFRSEEPVPSPKLQANEEM